MISKLYPLILLGFAFGGFDPALAIDPCNPPLASSVASRPQWLVIDGRPMTEAEIRAEVAKGYPKLPEFATVQEALENIKTDATYARFFSAVWHITCADGPGDRELLRKLMQGPNTDDEIAYALATLGEPGARELYVQRIQKKRPVCSTQVIDAGRILALDDPRGVLLFFAAFKSDPLLKYCIGSAKLGGRELATQAAKLEDFAYVEKVLALLEKDPKVFNDLVAELLARGAAIEKWRAASCLALRTMKVEDRLSQLLVKEQTRRYCSNEKTDVDP